MSEVVGLFANRSDAENAIAELTTRGYDAGNLGYVDRHRDESGEVITDEGYFEDYGYDEEHEVAEEAGKGAVGGAIGRAAVSGVGYRGRGTATCCSRRPGARATTCADRPVAR
jgi:hypothetical protein